MDFGCAIAGAAKPTNIAVENRRRILLAQFAIPIMPSSGLLRSRNFN